MEANELQTIHLAVIVSAKLSLVDYLRNDRPGKCWWWMPRLTNEIRTAPIAGGLIALPGVLFSNRNR